jgi:rhodanese-related sulfurtransferase
MSCKLILCLMALSCLLSSACAEEESPAAGTYSDPAVNEMKQQVLQETKAVDKSYKGEPWSTSPLNDSNKVAATLPQVPTSTEGSSSSYMSKADSFLKGAGDSGLYSISAADLIGRMNADPNWVILDVGAAEFYANGHPSAAMNIPLADLIASMGTIPSGKKVVVYSSTDISAAYAVETLRVFGGFDAWLLQGGAAAWQAAGMPLEQA